MGSEGQAPKDYWHWEDASFERCFQAVQEWIQVRSANGFWMIDTLT
jgi:hypothetical protein